MSQFAASLENNSSIVSTNPSNGYEVLGEVEISSKDEVTSKVDSAISMQKEWYSIGIETRIQRLGVLLDIIKGSADTFAEKTSLEMGQPINLSTMQVQGAINSFQWNLENASEILEDEVTFENEAEINKVVYDPLGTGACIMAWNFPLPNFVWSVLQALIAGNTMVVKYSEEIPLFSKFLEKKCEQAGLEGIVNFVYGDGEVGKQLVDRDIDFISFTGSYATGAFLYKKAAEKFIPVILELGGSSPGVVFADADLGKAVNKIFDLRFINCGQYCSDIKRLIVHNSIIDDVTEKLVGIAKGRKLGNSLLKDTEMGPLVAERQVVRIEMQVKDALEKGAIVLCGGKRPEGLSGAYYEPTILSNITKDMKVWGEEVFGPVLPIIGFDTYDEAVELANDTEYGLTGYVFTSDNDMSQKMMMDIKAGGIAANISSFVKPQNPFGGYKKSGIGRENGKYGYHDVTQIKVLSWEK